MKVLICLESGLSGTPAPAAPGDLEVTRNVLSLSWSQPPEGEEKCESVHRVSYKKLEDVLRIERTGDNTTDLSFSPKTRTQGLLSTPYGDFAMDVETRKLLVPEELWHMPEEAMNGAPDEVADVFSGIPTQQQIQLSYFLHISGQEPMPNDIAIQITLEKNRE